MPAFFLSAIASPLAMHGFWIANTRTNLLSADAVLMPLNGLQYPYLGAALRP
ncbi:MAG: hypothetical protein ACI85K_002775 [Hyphomicrobiaceae bacterium]